MYTHLMQVSKVYLKVEYKSQYYHLILLRFLIMSSILWNREWDKNILEQIA